MFQTTVAALSDKGNRRRNNEDWTAHFEPASIEERTKNGCLYIVADGVGGAAKGEQASRYIGEKVLYEYYHFPSLPPAERLSNAMRQAGNEIYQYAEEQGEGRMATTLVAAVVLGTKLIVANVGDSRAYLLRDGVAYRITEDHSMVGELVRAGQLTEEEALHSKVKNSLTRSLGGERDTRVDLFEVDLKSGDRILLSTDGLLRYTLDQDICDLMRNGTPDETVKRMVTYALEQGGADNITVLVVEIGQPLEAGAAAGLGSQATPQPAEWELMATETDYTPSTSSKAATPARGSLQRRIRNQHYNLLYGLFAGAALLLIVMVVMLINWSKQSKEPDLTPSPGTTSAAAGATLLSTSTSTVTATNIVAGVLVGPQATEQATDTPQPTDTQTSTPIMTPTWTVIPAIVPKELCMERVDQGDTLSVILGHYDVSYSCDLSQPECQQQDCEPLLTCTTFSEGNASETWKPEQCDGETCSTFIYYKSDDCKKVESGEYFECSNMNLVIFDTDRYPTADYYWRYPIIQEGDWIVIPYADIETCEMNGGKIFYEK